MCTGSTGAWASTGFQGYSPLGIISTVRKVFEQISNLSPTAPQGAPKLKTDFKMSPRMNPRIISTKCFYCMIAVHSFGNWTWGKPGENNSTKNWNGRDLETCCSRSGRASHSSSSSMITWGCRPYHILTIFRIPAHYLLSSGSFLSHRAEYAEMRFAQQYLRHFL